MVRPPGAKREWTQDLEAIRKAWKAMGKTWSWTSMEGALEEGKYFMLEL